MCGRPRPRASRRRTDGPGIPVTEGFIYPPPPTHSAALRTAWPGRGGRPGGRGVEGRREVRCSRARPGKFPCRPGLGVAALRGAPVLAPGTPPPPRPCGRALGWPETLRQFPSIRGTPPLHPSPAPHPTPRGPPRGCQLQPVPHELAGPGRSLLFRFGKVFKGFFVALLVSDWALGGGKGGRSVQVLFPLHSLCPSASPTF